MGTNTSTRKTPLDRLASRKTKQSRLVWIPLDSEQADAHQELEAELAAARLAAQGRQRPDIKADERLDELEADFEASLKAMRENSLLFVAKSIGYKAWDELQTAYPPTDKQVKDARKKGFSDLQFDPDRFPPAAIQACVEAVTEWEVDDKDKVKVKKSEPLTEEFVTDIWDSEVWTLGELMSLYGAVNAVNAQQRQVDLGNGSRRTRR
jgi:hypothetical protein